MPTYRGNPHRMQPPGSRSLMQTGKQFALSGIHRLNACVRPIDRKLWSPDHECTTDPLFVVGLARSGSTLLLQTLTHALRASYLPRILDYGYGMTHLVERTCARQLRRHQPIFKSRLGATPGLLSPSEAFGFWRRWFWKGHEADHYQPHALANGDAADLRRTVYEVQAHHDAPLVVKCLYLSLSVPALADAFPQARFLFLSRDPLDMATSVVRNRPPHTSGQWWSIRPPGFREHLAEPATDQALWQIAEVANRLRVTLQESAPGRWRRVEYETLCGDPHGVVADLADWLEPAGFRRWDQLALPPHFVAPPATDDTAKELRMSLKNSRYFSAAREAMK